MDAAGTAVGIASLGIQICQSLLSYYDSWKGFPTDISDTYESIADLAKTFTILKGGLNNDDEETVRVEKSLESCTKGLQRLEKRLSKLRSHSEPQGLRQKTWSEIQRAWYPLRASTLVRLRADVSELRDNLSVALQTLQHAKILQGFQQTAEWISEILSGQRAAEYRACMDWLSPPDPLYDHDTARRSREPETGRWLLQSEKYRHWCASDDSSAILWLTGRPGCGKTVLCSTVIDDIGARSLMNPNTQFAFFYFSFSDQRKQSYTDFLSSLIAQLLNSQPAFDCVQKFRNQRYSHRPSREVLEQLLSICLDQRVETIIALDALDELSEGNDGRSAVVAWLNRTIRAHDKLKVFATSRRVVELERSMASLKACQMLPQAEFADRDIQKYVTAEIEKHPRLSTLDPMLKSKVKEIFQQKANGIFRWAMCQLEALKSLKSMRSKHVENALSNLPTTLDATYERMLLRIDNEHRDEALAALRWLAFKPRPMTLGELWGAYLIDYENSHVEINDRGNLEDILEILGGLITVEERMDRSFTNELAHNTPHEETPVLVDANSRVRLAHFSVKEYLMSSRIARGNAATFALQQDRDQRILTQSCLMYLLYYSRSPLKTLTEQDLTTFTCLHYVAKAWTLLISKTDEMTDGLEMQLLHNKDHLGDWLTIYEPDCVGPPFERLRNYGLRFYDAEHIGSGLYYASCIGLTPAIPLFLSHGYDVNAWEGRYGTALHAATIFGNVHTVRSLIEYGADVNNGPPKLNSTFRPVLHHSSSRKDLQIVKLLLGAGADPNARSWENETALHVASKCGNLEAMKLLLDAGADVDAEHTFEGTALQIVCHGTRSGVRMIRVLLDGGADANTHAGRLSSPLQALCTCWSNYEAIKLLLDAGADVNAQGRHYGSALETACRFRAGRRVVELLLDAGADINTRGPGGGTALEEALLNGDPETLTLLLDRGADINSTTLDATALERALSRRHIKYVHRLPRQIRRINGGPAKSKAPRRDYVQAFRLLSDDAGTKIDHFESES